MAYNKKKVWLWVGGIFFVILLVVIGISWHFINNIEKKAYSYVVESVKKSTNGLYDLEIGNISIKILEETVRLKNVQLKYDTTVFNLMKMKDSTPQFLYEGEVKFVDIEIYDLIRSIRTNTINVNKIDILNPDIKVWSLLIKDKQKHKKDSLSGENSIASSLQGVILKEINIQNGNFYFYDNEKKTPLEYFIEDYSLKVKNLEIDLTLDINEKLPVFEDLEVKVGKFKYELLNYNMEIKDISLDLKKFIFHIDSLNFIPKYSKYEFAPITRTPARAEIYCSNIDIVKLDYLGLIYSETLKADSVYIGNLSVSSYKNKNIPPTSKVKPLFHEIIQGLPLKIEIPMIELDGGKVRHEELAAGRSESGYIEFNDLKAKIYDLTNIISANDQYSKLEGNASFMKSGKFNITLLLPVDPQNEHFNVNGSISGLNLSEINTILEPASHLSIETGIVSSLYFNMNGDDSVASMDMIMSYHDLKVALLDNYNERKKVVLSELANDLILIKDNPSEKEDVRKVTVSAKRNLYLYEFNYIWITLFEGVKQSIGFTEKKQQQIQFIQETINSLKSDKDQDQIRGKDKREAKRHERKERKEKRKESIERIKNS